MSFPESDHLRRRRQRNPHKIKPDQIAMKLIWKFIHPYVVNWKTTFAGVGMILGGASTIAHELVALASGGTPDLEIISMAGGTIVGGIGLIAGRDADKSSEQSR
jgi:hypothetical protein